VTPHSLVVDELDRLDLPIDPVLRLQEKRHAGRGDAIDDRLENVRPGGRWCGIAHG